MEEPRIDKTVYTGRPENTEGRLEKEIAVYDFLDSFGIEYKRADHEALMTMEACEAVDQILGAQICKNLFLCNRQKTDFYLLLMPGEKPFKTKFLSKQIGTARLSFADGEQMEEYLYSRLPYYMIPKHMHCLEQFPLNTSSKTDRKKIQELI